MPDGWKRLERDLCSWLGTLARLGLEYRNPHQAITGFPPDGFRSDGCLTDGRTLLAVEVEAAQMHPDTNVGKYWLLHASTPYKRIILFHVYTPDFNSYPWRMKLGQFYAERMRREVPMEYVFLDRRQAVDYETTLTELKALIGKRVAEEFCTSGDASA